MIIKVQFDTKGKKVWGHGEGLSCLNVSLKQLLCGEHLIEMQKLKYNFLAYISLENEHS